MLAHTAAEFINLESNRESLITVTRSSLSNDKKRALIYISVLPETYEESALSFLKRKRNELRAFLKKKTRLRFLPQLDFTIDYGEKNRLALEALSE
jgi:ribosome-binding factor A